MSVQFNKSFTKNNSCMKLGSYSNYKGPHVLNSKYAHANTPREADDISKTPITYEFKTSMATQDGPTTLKFRLVTFDERHPN